MVAAAVRVSAYGLTMQRFLLALTLAAATTGCSKPQFATVTPGGTTTTAGDPTSTAMTAEQTAKILDLVALDARATHRYIKAGEATEVLMRVRVSTQAQDNAPRPVANIALVVDTSASMKGEAIEHAREAGLAMLDALAEGDRLSVIVFHSRAEVLIPSTLVSKESALQMRAAIQGMEAVGTTAMAEGLSAGLQQLQPYVRPGDVSRVVLLSDGVPNDQGGIRGIAAQAAAQSIGIAALGLGVDYDEVLLADIATQSGGRFHFVESADEVATMFRDEVLHIDRLVALRSTLTLRGGPGVTITEVVGQPNIGVGTRRVSFQIGDLAEQETKDIIVRLAVGEHRGGATVELIDATLSYTDGTGTGGTLDRAAFLAVEATDDDAQRASAIDVETQLLAAKAVLAAETLRIVNRAQAGDVKGALAQLKVAKMQARTLVATTDDPDVAQLARELSVLDEVIREAEKTRAKAHKARHKSKHKPGKGGPGSVGYAPAPFPNATQSIEGARSIKRSHSRAFNALH